MMAPQSQRDVSTINEGSGDAFDEEYYFSAGYDPNASFSLGTDDNDTSATSTPTSSTGFNITVDRDDEDENTAIAEAAPPSFSTPPVHRSVDALG